MYSPFFASEAFLKFEVDPAELARGEMDEATASSMPLNASGSERSV